MAINPETAFTGKITPSSASYPYGEARDVTTPGDGTGTPWVAMLVNDLFGFQQAITTAAGIVPSGTPETALASQYLQALKVICNTTYDTMATATADGQLAEGQLLWVQDRGDSLWKVVLTSSVTPNTFDIVVSAAVPTLSLVLQTQGFVDVTHLGATPLNDLSIFLTAAQVAGYESIRVPPLKGASYQAQTTFVTSARAIIELHGAKVNVTHDGDFIQLGHEGSQTWGGEFIGTGKADATRPLQAAIRIAVNTVNCVIMSPTVRDIAGGTLAGGLVNSTTVLNHEGNRIVTPTVTDCNVGINWNSSAEYANIVGGGVSLCNVGLRIVGGNNVADNLSISNNVVGVDIVSGANDSHGSVNNCQINHNTTSVRVGAIASKLFEFNNCHIFFGIIALNGCEGVVFRGGEMNSVTFNETECRNCFVIGTNMGASITVNPNLGGNPSELFFLDLINPISVSAVTSRRINGLRVFASNNGAGTVAVGTNQYKYDVVSQQIPFNAAYTMQELYNLVSGDVTAADIKIRGGFEMPMDVRLSLSQLVPWDPADCIVYLEDLDTGARIAELMPQSLFVTGANNIYTYQFSGIIPKANMGLFTENNTGAVLSTFSDQANSIRSYLLTTVQ